MVSAVVFEFSGNAL
ncbi:hypothetical protein VCEM1536_003150A, partial [Vibrio cholerae O1 str. EM-1536]